MKQLWDNTLCTIKAVTSWLHKHCHSMVICDSILELRLNCCYTPVVTYCYTVDACGYSLLYCRCLVQWNLQDIVTLQDPYKVRQLFPRSICT